MPIKAHKKGDTWFGMTATHKDSLGNPVDLTGHTAISRFRLSPTAQTAFEFRTSDGSLTIPNPINGKILYQKRIINVPANTYYFDLQITNSQGDVFTIGEGTWQIIQDVT